MSDRKESNELRRRWNWLRSRWCVGGVVLFVGLASMSHL